MATLTKKNTRTMMLANRQLSEKEITSLPGLKPYDKSRGVRVVKEVLPVGSHKSPLCDEAWDVTTQTLSEIAADFDKMTANGRESVLAWGNWREGTGKLGQHRVIPQDRIGKIDQTIVHGDKLYIACYCEDAGDAAKIKAGHKVSVGVKEDCEVGGVHYGYYFDHVAIVNNPVIGDQGPFYFMSEDVGEGGDDTASGGDSSDPLKGEAMLLAKLKAKYGFGDEVTAENIDAAIEAKLKPAPEKKPDGDTASDKALAELQGQVRTLANQVTVLVAEKADTAKSKYAEKLAKLFKDGRIDSAKKKSLEELGPVNQHNLALLNMWDDVKVLADDPSGQVRFLASGEPDIGARDKPESTEEINKRLIAEKLTPLKIL